MLPKGTLLTDFKIKKIPYSWRCYVVGLPSENEGKYLLEWRIPNDKVIARETITEEELKQLLGRDPLT